MRRIGLIILIVLFAIKMIAFSDARETFDTVDQNLNNGNGYKDYNNENATLAWGESYIMMSYMIMYEATGDTYYLDKLANHADSVQNQRDDVRGVTDYRGLSTACWRNLHYQPNNEPYCYVVHSGMIIYPMAWFVEAVYKNESLWNQYTYDGSTYKEKADWLLAKIQETVAAHDDQWREGPNQGEGYYIFRPDAYFLNFPGHYLPLNQQNAMGRALIILATVTGRGEYYDKAIKLATYFKNRITFDSNNCAVWNYWGDTYSYPGEDISHAAINAEFARLAYNHNMVFPQSYVEAIARTFVTNIYIDSQNSYSHIGGGGTINQYREQCGRWGGYSQFNPSIYTIIKNIYDRYEPNITSGSMFVGFANVVLWELPDATFDVYSMTEWQDMGDYWLGISSTPNLQFHPPDKNKAFKMRISYASDDRIYLQQYGPEGNPTYHTIHKLADTTNNVDTIYFTYLPDLYYQYYSAEVLYQFYDGTGFKLYKANSSIGTPLPTYTPTPSPTPTPTNFHYLSFTESDTRVNSLAGYHYLEVFVNHQKVATYDIGQLGNFSTTIDISPYLWNGDLIHIAFQLKENQGVSNYSIDANITNVELVFYGEPVTDFNWTYFESNSVFNTSGPINFNLSSNQSTNAGDYCRYGTIAFRTYITPTPSPVPTYVVPSFNLVALIILIFIISLSLILKLK